LAAHAHTIVACDFLAVKTVLKRHYAQVFIEHGPGEQEQSNLSPIIGLQMIGSNRSTASGTRIDFTKHARTIRLACMTPPDDYLLALGRVAAAASMMDVELMLAYVALAATRKPLAKRPAEHRARIIAALDACGAANQERNRLIHDAWAFSGEGS
jgi:hypothetical protein